MTRTRTAASALLALALAACVGPVATTSPQTVRNTIDPRRVQGPYVPAGTVFTARMNTTLDTMASPVGQPFAATVEVPLVSPDGTTVVPRGAQLRGRLVSTGGVNTPRLRLDLESVDTTRGPARIAAAVRHAQRNEYAGPTTFVPAPGAYYDDPFLYPYNSYAWGPGPIGGGPAYAPYTPTEIHVPPGAQLRLVLTRPLVPPGTTVQPGD